MPLPPLYPFQKEGVKWLLEKEKTILADQQGLGKTVQAMAAWEQLAETDTFGHPEQGPRILILGTRASTATWKRLIKKFWGWEPCVVLGGTKESRQRLWRSKRVILTTHATFRIDFADVRAGIMRHWDLIICDEAHRYLRNRRTKTFAEMRRHKSNYLWLLSGTPARTGAQDLWGYLHLIDPPRFSSYWRFIDRHFLVDDESQWGKEILGLKNRAHFRALLRDGGLLLRRTKAQVELDLPPKIVQPVYLAPTAAQLSAYEAMAEELIAQVGGRTVISPSDLAATVRLRQLLITPKLLNPEAERGAALSWIIDDLLDRPEDERHCVIICLYRAALEIFEKVLLEAGLGPCVHIHGGMTINQLNAATETFRNDPKTIGLLSLYSAESFELETASHVYMLGFSGSPDVNEQAEDRVHRVITQHTVNYYYLVHEMLIDDHILDITQEQHQRVGHFVHTPERLRWFVGLPSDQKKSVDLSQ